jgi:quercetin dioxygenase-like cupin family protein
MQPMNTARRALVRRTALAAAAYLVRSVCAFADSAPLDEMARELLEKMHSPALQPFLSEWPEPAARRASQASSLPVLRNLPQIRAGAPPFSAALVDALAGIAASLAWRRSYSSPSVSAQFLDNYGWTEFVGLTGPLPGKRLACGVLLLGPDTTYPAHHHEAEEIYVPLSGRAAWKQGGGDWREQNPGTVIHHAPHEPHAMRTGSSPLLALYVWRTDNLAQKSQLD